MRIWYILVAVFLMVILYQLTNQSQENFISGEEKLLTTYDQIYPLDHPKYVTPQQKDFQIVLSEHSALDPNMQNRRQDIRTQRCQTGANESGTGKRFDMGHCFSSREWHALNYPSKSAPDVINSMINVPDNNRRTVIYNRHNQEKVVPANSTCREMRADLFDEIMIPDLFFSQRRMIKKSDPDPTDRNFATEIF